ncbi:MAG: CotH kinase family protein [Bacteroidales bacterium]|nr:CotH kinase family protein [Bacteroidales bacterium]
MKKQPGILFFLVVLFLLSAEKPSDGQGVRINEMLASNQTVNMDSDYYAFSDWIELYNPGSSTVALEGYYLSNEHDNTKKWAFPTTANIPARGYLLVWADSMASNGKALHTNFKLNKEGGFIFLSGPGNPEVDSLEYPPQKTDIAYGRNPGNSNAFLYYDTPTPGAENITEGLPVPVRTADPIFTRSGGMYDSPVTTAITCETPGAVIHYTMDGSLPGLQSPVFTTPILIDSSGLIRAMAFTGGYLKSHCITQTYLIHENVSLPVISITMDPAYFWNEWIGFYVEGKNGLTGWETGHGPSPKSNFNRNWRRPAHIDFFDENYQPGFSVDGEVKIYGGWTRGAVIKSLSVYPEHPIHYPLFKSKPFTEYESFIIRNGGNQWAHTKLHDAVLQSLAVNETDVDLQANRPAVLYINGEFWGVMNIREKINEDYIKTNHNVNQDNVDYIESYRTVKAGDNVHLTKTMSYLANHDLSIPEYYNQFKKMVDVKECLNYFMTGIYSGHGDWIYNNNNNLRTWRPRTPDGRWRWLLYDTDGSFSSVSARGIGDAMSRSTFLRKLLANPEAQHYFINTFSGLLNSSFAPPRVLHMIDSLKKLYEHDMPRHIDKWRNTAPDGSPAWWKSQDNPRYIQQDDGYGGPCLASYSQWESYFSNMRYVARNRPAALLHELRDLFVLGEIRHITLQSSGKNDGIIEVNGILHRYTDTAASYFEGQTLDIRAVPKYGHIFRGWYRFRTNMPDQDSLISRNPSLSLIVATDTMLKALFDTTETENHLHINEVMAKNYSYYSSGPGYSTDWIELYNDADQYISTGNLYLTNDLHNPRLCRISDTDPPSAGIPPDGYEIFWADKNPEKGYPHLNFKLDGKGGMVGLFMEVAREMILLDSLSYGGQLTDISLCRMPDGKGPWLETDHPTPGSRNEIWFKAPLHSLYINEYKTSSYQEDGKNWLEIYNANDFAVDAGGLFLTNDLEKPFMWRIPSGRPWLTTIPAKGFLVFRNNVPDTPEQLFLDFHLDRDGGEIGLTQVINGAAAYLDYVHYGNQRDATSGGRYPDGTGPLYLFDRETPGQPNAGPTPVSENKTRDTLLIYPNPSKGDFFIQLPGNVSGRLEVRIYNITGEMVFQRINNIMQDTQKIKIKAGNLIPGMYIIMISDRNHVMMTKMEIR